MSETGYAESLLGGLDQDLKRVLTELVRYIIPKNRFGPVDHQEKSINFEAYYLNSTTPASSNTEFSILHGLARVPSVIVPVLALDQVNAQVIPLQVSRAADASRVYLKSPSTSAAFSVLVE